MNFEIKKKNNKETEWGGLVAIHLFIFTMILNRIWWLSKETGTSKLNQSVHYFYFFYFSNNYMNIHIIWTSLDYNNFSGWLKEKTLFWNDMI